MALTNIELYEALKKDVSEDSARMIAEAVPKASDLATKGDLQVVIDEMRAGFRELERTMEAFHREMLERFAAADRRMLRYVMAFGVPLWIAFIAALGKIILGL